MNRFIELFRKELWDIAVYADDTVANYISCLYQYTEFASNTFNIEIEKSTPKQLRLWMTHLKKTGVSNSRLSHHRAALKLLFTFLVKMNIIKQNPADGLFPFRKVKSNFNQPINKNTAYNMLKSIDRGSWIGRRNFMIISCLWALGLRRKELIDLKIEDFNPGYDPQNKIGLLIVNGKGNKQRALFVVDKLYDNLIDYLKDPASPKQSYKPIFPTKQGKKISGDQVLKIVHQAAQKAGISQRITPHVLRHSFATEMYLAKTPLANIQDLMGHETQAETSIYIHVPEQMKRLALQQIAIDGKFSWPFLQGGISRLAW
jgi:integrase/recombinase XerD